MEEEIFFKIVEWAKCHIAPNSLQRLKEERKRVESRVFFGGEAFKLEELPAHKVLSKTLNSIAVSEAEVE